MFTISQPPIHKFEPRQDNLPSECVVTAGGPVDPIALDEVKIAIGPEYLTGDLAVVCRDELNPMRNMSLTLATRGAVISAPASCAENLNLDKKCLHAAMNSLSEYAAGRPVMLLVSLPTADSMLVERLRRESERSSMRLILCETPRGVDNATDAEAEICRLVAETQVGIRCEDDAFVPIGALGPINVMDTKALRVAASVSLFFKPVPMPISIYCDHTNPENRDGSAMRQLIDYGQGKLPGVPEEEQHRLAKKLLFLNPIPWRVEDKNKEVLEELIATLNEVGAHVCLTIESHSFAIGTWPTKSTLMRASEWIETRARLSGCRQIEASGLFGRIDQEVGGGEGYAARLRRMESSRNKGAEEETRTMLEWLTFSWAPKLKHAEFVSHFKCDVCTTVFPCRDNEPLRKFDYTYCTMSCLTTHRKGGFKPSPAEAH